MLDLTMAHLIPLLISASTATVVSYFFMGNSVLFHFANVHPFQLKNLWMYIVLGIFLGLLGLYFTRMTLYLEKRFSIIKNQIIRLLTGGVILGILIFIFPPLWGEGYTSIKTIFSGHGPDLLNNSIFFMHKDNARIVFLVLGGILIFKVFAMAATTASGGIGGIFAPTLFMGAMGGYFFVRIMNTGFGFHLPEDNFALAGMAGMMAAVMHAPLTGIFLTVELTSSYELFIPLLITSTVAYITIMRIEPHSIYTKKLALQGQLITHHKDHSTLIQMEVRKLIESDFEIISPDSTLGDLVKAISRSKRNLYPVVDRYGYLKGMVKMEDVKSIIFEHTLYDKVKVKDLMYMPQFYIAPDDDMEKVVEKFETSGRFNLAVIDNGRYIGFISRAAVYSNYRKKVHDSSNE
jgi:CIC family chloride channel protein